MRRGSNQFRLGLCEYPALVGEIRAIRGEFPKIANLLRWTKKFAPLKMTM